MMTGKVTMAVAVVVLVLAMVFGVMVQPQGGALAAPAAGPTPVSVTRPASPEYAVYELFATDVITSDTTAECVDVGPYSVIDAQYEIDQTDVNTVTVTTQWSVTGSQMTDGLDVVASNAADASDLVQLQTFARFLCAKADVTNSNAVTVTLFVLAK